MPELPEVETVRRGLAPVMEGAVIEKVEQRRPDLRKPFPARFARRITGRRVTHLGRRAKYLLADLDDGTVLVMHLGMSGSFRVEANGAGRIVANSYRPRSKLSAHDHVVFHLSSGVRVIFNDPRRFGLMDLVARSDIPTSRHFHAIGIEPLGNELSGVALARLFAGRKAPLKAALMDQRLVAGLGNIYVCEALWRARLSPDAGGLACERRRKAARACGPSRRSDPRRARGGDRRRRVVAPRPHPHRRRARRLPARFCGLRSRGRTLPAPELPRHHPPQGPFRPLDLLLPGLPTLIGRARPEMAHENIIVEMRGRVGLIRLNRPQALNALGTPLIRELIAVLRANDRDDGVGATVLTGSEKAFAAGADIKEMAALGFVEAFTHEQAAEIAEVAAMRKPIIAAVAGYCLGGGAELALMCDILIAAETARFGQPEITLGIMPGMGGTQRLPRAVGKAKAMDLILTGRMMDAAEAERAGLVARVVPAADLLDEAFKIADKIATFSRRSWPWRRSA